MPSANMSVDFVGYQSEVLSFDQFGTNMLFHSDSVSAGSDFSELIAESGIRFVRYPGGTLSEEYFDLANPNSTSQSNILDILSGATKVRAQDVVPLEDFLSFCQDIGGRASIVLPTYRYFDPITGLVSPEAEVEVREFVRNLLTGTYGPVDNPVLELGNEWYQHRFDWSVEEFGQIQAIIASWIDDEADLLGLRDAVTILAQAGRTEAENNTLSSYFTEESRASIDGVLTHLYGTNSQGNPLGIGSGIGNRLEEINDIWTGVLGTGFELAVTEWNVGENGEDDTLINGLMRLAPLMRIYGEMLANGVDLAMIWSAQTNGPAGLSGTEGTGSEFSPTGYFYSMLSHSIQGMRLIDTGNGNFLRDDNGDSVGVTYTFEDNGSLASYFVSGVGEDVSLEVDLTAFQVPEAYVYATILGAAEGNSGTEYWTEASVRHITDIDLSFESGWQFTHQIGAYELVELHVVVGEGVTIAGDSQNAIADAISGSDYADHLSGKLGDDTISGANGDDFLEGGVGNDLLSGENDHDTLEGGEGNDTLIGGNGRDLLDGGSGNDFLDGGRWNDTLFGGDGHDTLLGGEGNDLVFMADDGGLADGGAGQDTLSFIRASEGVTLWSQIGVAELDNMEIVEYLNFEIFQGSQHNDRITVYDSDKSYFGEAGEDCFTLLSGSNNLIDMGADDDMAFVYSNGNNQISGGSGDDHFRTNSGSNRLAGDTGNDTFNLLSVGRDELVFRAGDGADQVHGFQSGVDQMEFHELNAKDLQISESGTGTLLDFGVDGSIFLDGSFGIELNSDLLFV